MNFSSIEFSEEQQPYKILVIPRAVDISEHIEEQEELKRKIDDDVGIEIINNRIISTTEIVENKNIIENEFYINGKFPEEATEELVIFIEKIKEE